MEQTMNSKSSKNCTYCMSHRSYRTGNSKLYYINQEILSDNAIIVSL